MGGVRLQADGDGVSASAAPDMHLPPKSSQASHTNASPRCPRTQKGLGDTGDVCWPTSRSNEAVWVIPMNDTFFMLGHSPGQEQLG